MSPVDLRFLVVVLDVEVVCERAMFDVEGQTRLSDVSAR